MDAFRIENLRSLGDTGFVQLRPITLLVGQNSSGKSTFLRALPLLRQSVGIRATNPILWWGDYVDFGNFEVALNTQAATKAITFHFQFDSRQVVQLRSMYLESRQMRFPDNLTFIVSIKIVKDTTAEEGSHVGECRIQFADHNVELGFDTEGSVLRFKVNSNDLSSFGANFHARRRDGLLPYLIEELPESGQVRPERRHSVLSGAIMKELRKFLPGNAADYTIRLIADGIEIGPSAEMLKSLQSTGYVSARSKNRILNWTTDSQAFQFIRDLSVAQTTLELLPLLDTYITEFARNSKYIAPVRATADRYTRVQDLAVNEVDSRGQNLAMFLRSLTTSERQSFAEWTESYLGFASQAHTSAEHISLRLRETGADTEFNIADMGFGYSQVLPIITQLWTLTSRRKTLRQRMRTPVTFAIEQPELHLHPRLQARLADAFWVAVKTASHSGLDLRLIIETHSTAIVNRFGHLVANKTADPSSINVVLFDKSPTDVTTKVQISEYDKDGILTDWPYGFFEPNED